MSTAKAVRAAIRKLPRGRPFTGARFLKLGTRGAVDRTLSRLAAGRRDPASRPRRLRSSQDQPLRRDRDSRPPRGGRGDRARQWRDAPDPRRRSPPGASGSDTQVPAAPVFHTSGSTRTIRVAGTAVRMVHTANRRRLQFAGEPTGAAISALWYLGKDNVTPETVATIEAALGPAEFEKLRSADMPAWMQKAFAAAGEPAHG